jgi:hypothetical protein
MLFQVFNGHKSILKITVDKQRRRFLWPCGGGFPAAIQPLPSGLLWRSRLSLAENRRPPSLPAGSLTNVYCFLQIFQIWQKSLHVSTSKSGRGLECFPLLTIAAANATVRNPKRF